MTLYSFSRRALIAGAAAALAGFAVPASAADLDSIHFLIPGGAGGGWDGAARGTGEALTKSGIVENATFENMSGGGGGKAIGWLIENAESNHGTLMVNSTPIVIRSLTNVFPQNFRDLTMVASTIGDFAALVVRADSEYTSFEQVVADYNADPGSVAVGGGSVPGGMDHLVAALAFKAAGGDPTTVKYIPFDTGGNLNAAILSGEVDVGSTGFSEAVDLARAGEVRILAMTGDERSEAFPDAPTLQELGYDAQFVNWRGFFAAPGLPDDQRQAYVDVLAKMYDTPEWADVRDRNGWVDIFNPGDEFIEFLVQQEEQIGGLMKELGFL